ncbi:polysaccharide pyruvyl transferase family protein [Streptomyces sp. CMB-StM0423]|uniref:polysaccharide pyruvyl transferase family protein n=1 Tax=Streptomyces sp. CMB-StM0423 TaxID=2059884 RepID=UPI000C7096A2|nr:polysaccharide pyruvyl transferase family protein [Streptomyces sp. CMB-StM0423]AUH40380.1 polysaccharide pyruvyl transferase [Streptomyces sp. CMB-StM0423]
MKHLLIRSGKSPFHIPTTTEVIQQDLIGTNSGNLLFSDAVHKLLLTPDTDVTSNGIKTDYSKERAAQINEEYDAFVVPLANAFRPSFEASLNRLTGLIEQLTIPVVVIGVGAQVAADYDTERLKSIEPSVKRFMKAVLKRSASVGVRGELTAGYLNELGFKDVDIIGCPSMFLYGDTFPEIRRTDAGITDASRIAINVSPDAVRVGPIAEIAQRTYERFDDLVYYAQNLTDAELLLWGDTSVEKGLTPELPTAGAHGLLRDDKTRVPTDPYGWMAELRERDFAFGTRIHGNIAALLAGTPAVVLVHDSRTLELCRYFGIPHEMLADQPAGMDPAEVYEKADFSGLHTGHQERWDRFVRFLDRNDLKNTYSHGDGGAAFEKRMADLDLPPSIRMWDGSDDGAYAYRFAWLHERADIARKRLDGAVRRATELKERNEELAGEVERLEKRLAGLERRVTAMDKRPMARLGGVFKGRGGRG